MTLTADVAKLNAILEPQVESNLALRRGIHENLLRERGVDPRLDGITKRNIEAHGGNLLADMEMCARNEDAAYRRTFFDMYGISLENAAQHEIPRFVDFRKCLDLRAGTIVNNRFTKGPGVATGDEIRKIMDRLLTKFLACTDHGERDKFIHCSSTQSALASTQKLFQDVMS